MSPKDKVLEGVWGVGGVLVPALIVNSFTAHISPAIVFVGVFAAFIVGSTYGMLESQREETLRAIERESLIQAQRELIHAQRCQINVLKEALDLAGKKVQRLTERFVHGE